MILPSVPKKYSGTKTNIAGKWTQLNLTMYLQMMWNHIYTFAMSCVYPASKGYISLDPSWLSKMLRAGPRRLDPLSTVPRVCLWSASGGDSGWMCTPLRLGGGFKDFLCSSLPGEMIQFDEHIFQMGWFNHQLENFNVELEHKPLDKGRLLLETIIVRFQPLVFFGGIMIFVLMFNWFWTALLVWNIHSGKLT